MSQVKPQKELRDAHDLEIAQNLDLHFLRRGQTLDHDTRVGMVEYVKKIEAMRPTPNFQELRYPRSRE